MADRLQEAEAEVRDGVVGRSGMQQSEAAADPRSGHHLAIRAEALLGWAAGAQRDLPWRKTRDPWLVLVSEVMLQQTQVDRVLPYFAAFAERWPTPQSCAEADLAEMLAAWQGLGYPRRARNLWRAASAITERHEGDVPCGLDELLALPGVGPYTARAVQTFAFGMDTGVVDTNVGRILARWAGRRLQPAEAQELADRLVPAGTGWAWNQAMMDLGAEVCTKRAPRCGDCPVTQWCAWAGSDSPDPADRSAGVSTRQARFEGSDRQARGRLLAALASGPLETERAAAAMGLEYDVARAQRLVAELIAESLVSAVGDQVRLG